MSGFEEISADGLIIWPEAQAQDFRVDAAIYYEDPEDPGHWLPHSVFGGWGDYTSGYDCDHVGGQLYYHDAGGGQPYANAHNIPGPCPARIWIRAGVEVFDGSVVLSDEALRDRGYRRVHGPMPAPLDDAIEGDTVWCEGCDSRVLEEDCTRCCVCEWPTHIHVGSAVVIVDPSEGGLDSEPGIYVVLELPFVVGGYAGGYFRERALARIADLPAGIQTDYAGAGLCRSCSPPPGPSPRPTPTYSFGLLLRRARMPGWELTKRLRGHLLSLGARASVADASPELERLLTEVRRQALAGEAFEVRRLIRSAFGE